MGVVLVVAVVLVAKHSLKRGEGAAAVKTRRTAAEAASPLAPGQPPREQTIRIQAPASAPSVASESGVPDHHGAEAPGNVPASSGEKAATSSASPRPAVSKAAPGKKREGPLPGSTLKDCLKSGKPTMADFGMGTCKPCQAMEPILKEAAQDYWGRANIVFVELDKYPGLAREYQIMVMPTQIFFDAAGRQVDFHMGFMDRAEIDRRLAALGVKR